MGAAFCILLIIYKPEFTWPGLIIVLLGGHCTISLFRRINNKHGLKDHKKRFHRVFFVINLRNHFIGF